MVHSIAATTIRELGARHGLSNLSVHDLVEEFKIQDQNSNSNIRRRNYSLRSSCLIRLRH
ncbi:hypothetical protein HBI40_244660 [Parastagonospora nodorum]|nr:hypothetical protein HBI41_237250 [Parastagonospora nodorum]KAH6260497.1 hypothetical protein HBI40_244660 [Parastagonospora nodorum]